MKRILFVDDEPDILNGLRRMLRSHHNEWEMVFAGSGQEALEAAEAAAFDVLVTDMRMPGMDGAKLLTRFHERYPETVRFALSGHSEMERVARAIPAAHQFLNKPCDASELKDVVSRALALRDLLSDELVQGIVGETDSLPSRPETYSALVSALADSEVSIGIVVDILEADLAMSAKLLHLVNSGFFGLSQRIDNIEQATSYLGLDAVADLVLAVEAFQPPPVCERALLEFLTALQARSMWTARVARRMFDDKRQANQAFTAAMLHDVGLLVMATKLPDRLAEAVEMSREGAMPLHVAERELYSVTHAEIGGYLLGLWGLPYPLIEAAAYHHRPADLSQETFGVLTAVHVASALVESRHAADGAATSSCAQIDLSYLEALGVQDRLEEWEALVNEDIEETGSEDLG